MFLSNLLGSSTRRPESTRSISETSLPLPPEPSPTPSSLDTPPLRYLFDESQLQPPAPPPDHVLGLNTDLETLAGLFPDIQPEVFREMLSNFSEESKLFVITDKLLKNPSSFVKGRRRALELCGEGKLPLSRDETFRSPEYKRAVRKLALQEFKGLSKSSIDAILSETNYSYFDARPTLVDLSSKSWKFAISSLLFRRKPVTTSEAETHPLVSWKPSANGSLAPAIKATGNGELDRELFEVLIRPLTTRERVTREKSDHALAVTMQTEEAEVCEALYECSCCFTDSCFEEFTSCSANGHMLCFRCVQQSISEAVFGQGWQASIRKDTGALRCPAVASTECEGCIPLDHIRRAMTDVEKGPEILEKLDQRLAEHDLVASGLPLIRCPFCNYAEIDDLYLPDEASRPKPRINTIVHTFLLLALALLTPASIILITIGIVSLILSLSAQFRFTITERLNEAFVRLRRRQRGFKFVCQNKVCGRSSCLSCSKAWVDIHVCHESSLIALRTQVEQAMSMAIKRVCPRCNTSFVKSAGCNKLVCPCGYKMCYVCRKDIGSPNEGYQHFCQHFRPEGDGRQCRECNKCNLWETENTDAILRKAKSDAERRWKETEQRELSNAEKAFLESGVGRVGGGGGEGNEIFGSVLRRGRIPRVEEICDFIVETFFF